MKEYRRKLGILGGMGPEATAALYLGVIRRCQQQFGSKYNSDFPAIIINSAPVPDGRMWKGFNRRKVERFLRSNIRILERAGADFVAIPCNSVHYFMPAMRGAVQIPVLSIVEETARIIQKRKLSTVLLLATTFTARMGVYDTCFSTRGLKLVKPNQMDQRAVENIVVRVEGGKHLIHDRKTILSMARKYQKSDGVEGVIAGCTEIPLLVKSRQGIPFVDTIDVLASASYELIIGKSDFTSF